jgi:2-amino-4-hydroxy-6-hydroxymethyldihydropteridine diphosphokinase
MLNRAYLSLGSNIEPEFNLVEAVRMLAQQANLVAVSSAWETKPLGSTDQPDYINAAAIIDTPLTARQLRHDVISNIEQRLGRVRRADKYAPRTIDIDIMLFNHQSFTLERRQIPDPEVIGRPFVAIPLAEIAPGYLHPGTGQSLHQIAQTLHAAEDEMRPCPDVSKALQQVRSQQFKEA